MKRPTLLIPALLLAACAAPTAQAAPLQVSATTTIIADFVQVVGGSRVQVNVIVPAGADTHSFQPTTGAIRSLAQSRALFANGAGLEPWLPKLKASAPRVPVKELTAGLKLHEADHEEHGEHGEHGDEHADEHAGEHGPLDPHAWWDATLAAGYVKNAQATLTQLDPAGKVTYAKNAAAYLKALGSADAYAKKQFASIPAARRVIVTNHDMVLADLALGGGDQLRAQRGDEVGTGLDGRRRAQRRHQIQQVGVPVGLGGAAGDEGVELLGASRPGVPAHHDRPRIKGVWWTPMSL